MKKIENNSLEKLRELKDETINRWKKAGILDGLKGMTEEQKRNMERLYGCQQKFIINEKDEMDNKN